MRRVRLPLTLLVLGAAAYFSLSGAWPWPRFDGDTPAAVLDTVPLTPPEPAVLHVSDTLRRGETLSELFSRQRVSGIDLASIADVLDARRLRPGLVFNFRRYEDDSIPDQIAVRATPDTRLLFRRAASGWTTERQPIAWTMDTLRIEGAIDASLYEAIDAQLPEEQLAGPERMRLAWGIADIYAWQVDFSRDLQQGDRFQVLLERSVSEEGETRFGRVLAADLTLSDRNMTAFRFEDGDGRSAFYDTKGRSLRRAFLRAPLEFRRISSNFSRARRHPVLGRVRRHEGTDYAASTGTPVMAAGDGTVIRAGRAGGYGNLIEVRHKNGVTTRYGHLSRILVKKGQRVRQEQIIGKVGATGLASGPHLHYEFRINGRAVDSRRVDLGHGQSLGGRELDEFQAERDQIATLLYGQPPADLVAVSN
ncbi:MAG: peptidoglycan DD-metalloendopeptidase family protein [Gemmatimonadota bacterium]|jgi:murein DD-endopeptidase MepM/ murein hydrolase activator NlpD|nr:peptidoglycan DD-metalloendopeptidase family protein [Gemmatimonadota bacterium]